MKFDKKTTVLIKGARVARLATVDQRLHPYAVPAVFVFYDNSFFIPLDRKTKSVDPKTLRRVKNIEQNPNIVLLIDEYHEDWKRLFYLMIHGKARIIDIKNHKIVGKVHKLLIAKYPQYKKIGVGTSCIKINPQKVTLWHNS